MAIKITAKNKKLDGTFLGDIEFKKGVANVTGDDAKLKRAVVFAERSGLEYEDTQATKADKEDGKKKDTKKSSKKK